MSITRFNRFVAVEGATPQLKEFLASIVPAIQRSLGCEACRLLQSQDNPNEFVVVEAWESKEAHQASLKNIPPESIKKVMPLLASPPTGSYYAVLAE